MKICIVSPQYNGLMKYSKPLYDLFKNSNNEILYTGFPEICFDINKIEQQLEDICEQIISFNPDLIHYNYGTYDSEQLIFHKLKQRNFSCKSIYTYHSLQLDLFKKLNHPLYDEIANQSILEMDGIVFFTEYAKQIFESKYDLKKKSVVAYHPATHEYDKLSQKEIADFSKEYEVDVNAKNVMLLGYASHWKNTRPIIHLVKKFKSVNFYIAGPYWLGKVLKENQDFKLEKYKNLKIIDKELNQKEFLFFVDNGVGIFPYEYFKSFQGSGLLPNYLLKGKPCLVNDIEPLREYIGESEFCFDFSNLEVLEEKLNKILEIDKTKKIDSFSYQKHYQKIVDFYKEFK